MFKKKASSNEAALGVFYLQLMLNKAISKVLIPRLLDGKYHSTLSHLALPHQRV